MLAARLCRRDPRGRGRSAQARRRLPGRALGPLPARRRLVPPRRSDRRGDRAAAAGAAEPRAAGRRRRVPNASNAGDFSNAELPRDRALVPEGLPPAARVRGLQVGAALRVRQLPRAGVAEREAARDFTSAPTCRSRCARKSVRRSGVNRLVVRVDSRRQKFDIPPLSQRASGAFEGGWWNYNGILREVYLRRVDTFDFQRVAYQPSLRCRTLRRDDPRARHGEERQHRGRDGPDHGQLRWPQPALPRAPRAGTRRAPLPGAGADPQPAAVEPRASRLSTPAACSCARRAAGSCRSTPSTPASAPSGSAASGASS